MGSGITDFGPYKQLLRAYLGIETIAPVWKERTHYINPSILLSPKMDFFLNPLVLEDVVLPPIPGPIPPLFFVDVPVDAAAVFSTNKGTRPHRPLPCPVPVHSVRRGGEEDVQSKAWYLLKTQPAIAEAILTPPTTWRDLYHYFDAAKSLDRRRLVLYISCFEIHCESEPNASKLYT